MIYLTRMHSSRNVYRPLIDCMLESASRGGSGPGGVCSQGGLVRSRGSALGGSGPGGCLLLGGSALGGSLVPGGWGALVQSRGVCSWGGSAPRGVSQHALRQNPPLWTESQTPVKTLPWPNYVAAGKYTIYTVPN